jgi:YgiT-type zinc finger domain-containing protein
VFHFFAKGGNIDAEQPEEATMIDPGDPQWRQLTDEILSGMKEWREQHPKATFYEIEGETMKRMAQLQARLMQEIAQTSPASDWEEAEAPMCPECGAKMDKRGQQERSLQAQGGQEVVLQRRYAVCPQCGAGIFPPG